MTVTFNRIVSDPKIMRGMPCVKGTRVTVSSILGMLAKGHSREKVLEAFPELQSDDLDEVLSYAAWRLAEQELEIA